MASTTPRSTQYSLPPAGPSPKEFYVTILDVTDVPREI